MAPLVGVAATGATLAVACIDYDDDGDADLYEVNDYGMFNTPNRLWRNDGDGASFTDVAPELGLDAPIFGMGAAAADYDNDGDLDLYATNLAANLLHRNDGGAFTEIAREVGAAAMSFSDDAQAFLGWPSAAPDGDDAWQAALARFVGDYADTSSEEHLLTSWSAIFFDYDHDGWQDLFVANGAVAIAPTLPEGLRQPNRLLRNVGGAFVDATLATRTGTRGDYSVAHVFAGRG